MRDTRSGRGRSLRLLVAAALGVLAVAVPFAGTAASAPQASERALVTVTVNTLPIANGLPLDLGIKHGFFEQQGIEINKRTLQSGNDIVLGLSNDQGEIGYVGWVPAMIARTQGIRIVAVAASDVEGTSVNDNWQNILVKGSSAIRTPADLAGKTIAVNALKGVGEVMIKAALKKAGVNPDSIRLLALPFPAMPAALDNGQVDAIWTPEPFMSQALGQGARIVMAPGPVLGKFFPIGTYVARQNWATANPGLVKKFSTAMNRSLSYAQAHPEEIRDLLAAAVRNIRLPIWSPLADRDQLLQLARYSREFGVISTLPNMNVLVPNSIFGGKTLEGAVGDRYVLLRLSAKPVKQLKTGWYTIVVADRSKKQGFQLSGPSITRRTAIKFTGRATWTVKLAKGTYTFRTTAKPSIKHTFVVK
jgi:NitT/TauT family transport system substrate-binding protein